MIRVTITDDQESILESLKKILAEAGDMELVGAFTNGNALLQSLRHTQPDVAVLDIFMPGMSGIELARSISLQYPRVKALALTNEFLVSQVKLMMQCGAMGYLLKDASPATILEAIREVAAGRQFLYEGLQQQVLDDFFEAGAKGNVLTRREKDMIKLLAAGCSDSEIATRLQLSAERVANLSRIMMQKLGVENKEGLLRAAINRQMVV